MQQIYIEPSKPLNRYFTPLKQYSLQHRERAVEP
jgi:hypothetical protein